MMKFLDRQLGNPKHYSGALRGVHTRYAKSRIAPRVREFLGTKRVTRKKNLVWGFFWPALWPLTSALLRALASRQIAKGPENTSFNRAIMLVSDPASDRHWPNDTPDCTDSFARWLMETQGILFIDHASSLRGFAALPPDTVVVANYDWLANLLISPRPFRALLRETMAARRLRVPIWSPLIDLFGVQYSTYSSILVAASGGVNIIIQNDPQEAEKFGLPNVSGPHFWIFPPSLIDLWEGAVSWTDKRGAAVAFSGDARRYLYFPPLVSKLEQRGFAVVRTEHDLSFEDYVAQCKRTKIVATTCWLQPFYLVGPKHYARLLPAGHITRRVWEAFMTGSALITNDTPAIRFFGFTPGKHFVALPEISDGWDRWELPSDEDLELIAARGASQFRSLLGQIGNG